MIRVTVATDPLDHASREERDVEDLLEFLWGRFQGSWPRTARLYHGHVAESCDVTDRASRGDLADLPGPFHVVVYPAGPGVTAAAIATQLFLTAGTMMASYVIGQILAPSAPRQRGGRAESPNYALGARSNRPAVPGNRIPDHFGRVRAVPELIAVPYTTYDAHDEVEHALYCLGRGAYEVEEVRDGQTRVEEIRGAAVEVYGPGQVVGAEASVPEHRVGNEIRGPVLFPLRSSSVSGQELSPLNDQELAVKVHFVSPREIRRADGETESLAAFTPGGKLTVSGAAFNLPATGTFTVELCDYDNAEGTRYPALRFAPGQALPQDLEAGEVVTLVDSTWGATCTVAAIVGQLVALQGPPPDEHGRVLWQDLYPEGSGFRSIGITYTGPSPVAGFDGDYDVLDASEDTLVLDNPSAVAAGWLALDQWPDGISPEVTATLSQSGLRWQGPFEVEYPNFSRLVLNITADRGLFFIDPGGVQGGHLYDDAEPGGQLPGCRVRVEYRRVGDAEWSAEEHVVEGSATTKRARAKTIEIRPEWATGQHPGQVEVRVARVTPRQEREGHTFSDAVSWSDLYAMREWGGGSFGDVTVIRTEQRAGPGSFALRERQLNVLCTRRIPLWIQSGGFTKSLFPSRSAAAIFCAAALDPKIGRRREDEIDAANIHAAVGEVRAHFNAQEIVTEFSHTFDDANTSFEETARAIAQAAFCVAYRKGSEIRLRPELPQEDSTLLFNHRNVLPGSEQRTYVLGRKHDGVEFTYTSPRDDSRVTLYLPDQGAENPERIESIGIRSQIQAYYHAARRWQRQKYERVAVELQATEVAHLALPFDRVLIAGDGIRPNVFAGEVRRKAGDVVYESPGNELPAELPMELGEAYVDEQSGFVLTLSRPVDVTAGGYIIFLQHTDQTVEVMRLAQGTNPREVTLVDEYGAPRAPRLPLYTEPGGIGSARFWIVKESDATPTAFLVAEKEPQAGHTVTLRAVNYDPRYYDHDADWPSEDEIPDAGEISAEYLWGAGGYASSDQAAAVLAALEDLATAHLPAKDFDAPAPPAPPEPEVAVTITPLSAALAVDGTRQFTATVFNATNTAVTWSATIGSINASGLFTAPAIGGSGSVTATSVEDPTKSATALVTVTHHAQYLIDAYGSEAMALVVIGTLEQLVTVDLPANDYNP